MLRAETSESARPGAFLSALSRCFLYDNTLSGNCYKVRLLFAQLRLERQAKLRGGTAALKAMEGHLAQRVFLVDQRYTIADIALYAYTHVAPEGGFELEPYAAVRAWLERVRQQPGHVTMRS